MASQKKALVIVESPAKAKKIAGFLGDEYIVKASMGHIRDLPSSASEIPAAVKKESWSTLGVNVESDFDPLYVVSTEKKKLVTELTGDSGGHQKYSPAGRKPRSGSGNTSRCRQTLRLHS